MRRIESYGKKLLENPLVTLVPSLVILAALLFAGGSKALAPAGFVHRPLEMAGLWLLATLAALYRPFEGARNRLATLGLGTLVLPAALSRLGAIPAAWVAAAAWLSAELWRGFAARRSAADLRDANWLGVSVERAMLLAGAVLVAGIAAVAWQEVQTTLGVRDLVPALVYLLGLFVLSSLTWILREASITAVGSGSTRPRPSPRDVGWLLAPLTIDAAGWACGSLLHNLALLGSAPRAGALAVGVALLAAEAWRNARLRAAAEQRVADLERLQHAHKRILAEISGLGGIAQQILTECRNVLPVQWFQFELLEPDSEHRHWSAGPEGVLVEGEPHPEPRPRALPGVHRRVDWRILEKELAVDGDDAEPQDLAIVRLWCDPRRIEAGAEELFSTLVPQMASSLHRAQLDREAKLDPLTGVPVRRMLESRLQRAYRLCLEEGWSMAVLMCDIDFFKKINDTWGHAAGDAVLVRFAATLDAHRRENDLCCRYGGEEFTLLLENTGGEAALHLAERLRQAVAAINFEYEGQLMPLTMSVGVAAFPDLHIKTASELLLLADEALYEAKRQGRNRCLLNVGRGAYRAPAGATLRARESSGPAPAPRIF